MAIRAAKRVKIVFALDHNRIILKTGSWNCQSSGVKGCSVKDSIGDVRRSITHAKEWICDPHIGGVGRGNLLFEGRMCSFKTEPSDGPVSSDYIPDGIGATGDSIMVSVGWIREPKYLLNWDCLKETASEDRRGAPEGHQDIF